MSWLSVRRIDLSCLLSCWCGAGRRCRDSRGGGNPCCRSLLCIRGSVVRATSLLRSGSRHGLLCSCGDAPVHHARRRGFCRRNHDIYNTRNQCDRQPGDNHFHVLDGLLQRRFPVHIHWSGGFARWGLFHIQSPSSCMIVLPSIQRFADGVPATWQGRISCCVTNGMNKKCRQDSVKMQGGSAVAFPLRLDFFHFFFILEKLPHALFRT